MSLRRYASITQKFKDYADLMAYRSVGSLLPTSASSCGQPTADSCKSRWLWKRRRRGPSSGCFTRPILVVPPYVTSGASASGREALRADSDLRAYRPCHRKDGSAGTPELIHRRYYRRAALLSGMATCVSRRGTCRVFALINSLLLFLPEDHRYTSDGAGCSEGV